MLFRKIPLSCLWVPKLLTLDKKRFRVLILQIVKIISIEIKMIKEYFWRRIITTNETWVRNFISKTKQQSQEYTDQLLRL